MSLNAMLPRWETTVDIHRRTRELFNERNSLFTGWLFPYEEEMEPLINIENLPIDDGQRITK